MSIMDIDNYYEEIEKELKDNILAFWNKAIDRKNGGFLGKILNNGEIIEDAPKSAVLNTRILWTYSAVYKKFREERYLELARRAYDYLERFFRDGEAGGIFWLLDYKGAPIDTKKQIYAQAFCIYALAEYYAISNDADALKWAVEIFELIEEHSFDREYPGYFEALDRNWNTLEDVRLSEKEPNVNKTMNTHLHILESYTNFLKVWKNRKLKKQLKQLINIFLDKIIDSLSGHFNLFFDDKWNIKSNLFSYGHDIEGSWLLAEAAELSCDKALTERVKKASLRLANITLEEGMDEDGGIMNDGDINGVIDTDKHWWTQAEAMVGILNAFQISGDRKFFDAFGNCWNFIKKYVVDSVNGEWFFRVTRDGKPYYSEEDKLGPWKCPYHNSRACMELLERLKKLKNQYN
jgi:mannobiose 2-epimerase